MEDTSSSSKTLNYATIYTNGNIIHLIDKLRKDGVIDITVNVHNGKTQIEYSYE